MVSKHWKELFEDEGFWKLRVALDCGTEVILPKGEAWEPINWRKFYAVLFDSAYKAKRIAKLAQLEEPCIQEYLQILLRPPYTLLLSLLQKSLVDHEDKFNNNSKDSQKMDLSLCTVNLFRATQFGEFPLMHFIQVATIEEINNMQRGIDVMFRKNCIHNKLANYFLRSIHTNYYHSILDPLLQYIIQESTNSADELWHLNQPEVRSSITQLIEELLQRVFQSVDRIPLPFRSLSSFFKLEMESSFLYNLLINNTNIAIKREDLPDRSNNNNPTNSSTTEQTNLGISSPSLGGAARNTTNIGEMKKTIHFFLDNWILSRLVVVPLMFPESYNLVEEEKITPNVRSKCLELAKILRNITIDFISKDSSSVSCWLNSLVLEHYSNIRSFVDQVATVPTESTRSYDFQGNSFDISFRSELQKSILVLVKYLLRASENETNPPAGGEPGLKGIDKDLTNQLLSFSQLGCVPPIIPKECNYTVSITVVEATQLVAEDLGDCNPYVEVSIGKDRWKTSVVERNSFNPMWQQSHVFLLHDFRYDNSVYTIQNPKQQKDKDPHRKETTKDKEKEKEKDKEIHTNKDLVSVKVWTKKDLISTETEEENPCWSSSIQCLSRSSHSSWKAATSLVHIGRRRS